MVSAKCVTSDVGDTKWQRDWWWLWIFKRSSPHGQHERTPQNHQAMQCHVTPSQQPRSIWAGGWTNPYNGTRQQTFSTSDFNDVVCFTFVCTLVYLDHTVVLVQLDVRSRKGLNCYLLSVNLLEHTGNQVSTLEACIFNLRTQYRANSIQ